jgi:hypothetical protein
MMAWSVQDALTERFREGRETLSKLFLPRRRPGASYQGLTEATQRYGVALFHKFWARLRRTIPRRVGEAWDWHGWNVLAVDGSRVDAPRTVRNEEKLGKSTRDKSHPTWWITRLIHLPTRMMWDWRQGPGDSSERAHIREMIEGLPDRTLLVGDIGFGGFDFLGDLTQNNVAFLIRCGGNSTLLVNGTRQEIERCGDVRWVYLWPAQRRDCSPLRLRLIVVKRKGKPVYLLTNVDDPTRLSRRMAGDFYRARWDIEVEFRGLKQTMGHRKVLARTPEPGEMELAAKLVGMVLLLLHGALVMGAKVTRLSLAKALRAIRRAIEAVRHGEPCHWLHRALREALFDEYERRTSKQARDWPHKKRRKPPGPPKLHKLTRTEKTKIQGLFMQHRAVLG